MALTWDDMPNDNERFIAGSFIGGTAFWPQSHIDAAEINGHRYSRFLNVQKSRQACLAEIQLLESFVITHPDQDHMRGPAYEFMLARNADINFVGSIGVGKTLAFHEIAALEFSLVNPCFDDLSTVTNDVSHYFVDLYTEPPNPVRLRLQMLRRLLRLLQRALTGLTRTFQVINTVLQMVVRDASSFVVTGFHPPDLSPAAFSFVNTLRASDRSQGQLRRAIA